MANHTHDCPRCGEYLCPGTNPLECERAREKREREHQKVSSKEVVKAWSEESGAE
jgi:ribosomal protein L32